MKWSCKKYPCSIDVDRSWTGYTCHCVKLCCGKNRCLFSTGKHSQVCKVSSVVSPRSILGSDVLVCCDHMSENGITFDE